MILGAEVYREMGLQGVELVMLGYNTPSVNSQMFVALCQTHCAMFEKIKRIWLKPPITDLESNVSLSVFDLSKRL